MAEIRRIAILVVTAFALFAMCGGQTFTLIHTSSLRGFVQEQNISTTYLQKNGNLTATARTSTFGGLPRVRTFVDQIRAQRNNTVLALDGGQVIGFTPFDQLFNGEASKFIYQMIKFNAVGLGNSDFLHGPQTYVDGFAKNVLYDICDLQPGYCGPCQRPRQGGSETVRHIRRAHDRWRHHEGRSCWLGRSCHVRPDDMQGRRRHSHREGAHVGIELCCVAGARAGCRGDHCDWRLARKSVDWPQHGCKDQFCGCVHLQQQHRRYAHVGRCHGRPHDTRSYLPRNDYDPQWRQCHWRGCCWRRALRRHGQPHFLQRQSRVVRRQALPSPRV
eukprot:Opistho-2@78859